MYVQKSPRQKQFVVSMWLFNAGYVAPTYLLQAAKLLEASPAPQDMRTLIQDARPLITGNRLGPHARWRSTVIASLRDDCHSSAQAARIAS